MSASIVVAACLVASCNSDDDSSGAAGSGAQSAGGAGETDAAAGKGGKGGGGGTAGKGGASGKGGTADAGGGAAGAELDAASDADEGMSVEEFVAGWCAQASSCCELDGYAKDDAKCRDHLGSSEVNAKAGERCLALLDTLPAGEKRCKALSSSPICEHAIRGPTNHATGAYCSNWGDCEIPEGAFDAYCSMGYANGQSTNHCVYQDSTGGPGAKCATFDYYDTNVSRGCKLDLYCEQEACVSFAIDGEPCDGTKTLCDYSLICHEGHCVDSDGSLKEGEACDYTTPCAPGLICGGSLTCEPRPKLGEACDGYECAAMLDCISGVCVRNRFGTMPVCGDPVGPK